MEKQTELNMIESIVLDATRKRNLFKVRGFPKSLNARMWSVKIYVEGQNTFEDGLMKDFLPEKFHPGLTIKIRIKRRWFSKPRWYAVSQKDLAEYNVPDLRLSEIPEKLVIRRVMLWLRGQI